MSLNPTGAADDDPAPVADAQQVGEVEQGGEGRSVRRRRTACGSARTAGSSAGTTWSSRESPSNDATPGQGKRQTFGRLVDISASGVRIRAAREAVRPDQQIRVRLELPAFAGICPFVDTTGGQASP